jgi:hypothetical protein|tara:strand:+ start:416 stop:655 length:240 start_codon:yes stop_codon:yes gene_type:complete
VVNEGNGGAFGFASFLMFMSFFALAFATLFSFKDVRSGSGGFEDVGDTYGPIGGEADNSSEGVSYNTEDAVPPANSHDL